MLVNIDRSLLPDSETVCTVTGNFPFFWDELYEWVEAYRQTPLIKDSGAATLTLSAAVPSLVAGYIIGVRSERAARKKKAGTTNE